MAGHYPMITIWNSASLTEHGIEPDKRTYKSMRLMIAFPEVALKMGIFIFAYMRN